MAALIGCYSVSAIIAAMDHGGMREAGSIGCVFLLSCGVALASEGEAVPLSLLCFRFCAGMDGNGDKDGGIECQ